MTANTSDVSNDSTLRSVCPMPGPEEELMLHNMSVIMEGVIQLVVCILGMIGNLFSIFLLNRKELQNSFNQLLASLSAFDFIYLFTMSLEALRRFDLESIIHVYLFPYVLHPLNSIALTGSIYMTIAIALERYIAVHNPLDYNRVMTDATSHRRRLAGYLIPVSLVAIIFNVPKFMESKIIISPTTGHPYVDLTELRTSYLYVNYYHNWARLLVLGIIPFVVISFLNTKIYKAVRGRRGGRKRHDEHLSIVLMLIVLIFVICNLPSLMLNMHELTVVDKLDDCSSTSLMGFPVWSVMMGFCSQVLLCINSSANFFIYSCVGSQFRQVMYDYLKSLKSKCFGSGCFKKEETSTNRGRSQVALRIQENEEKEDSKPFQSVMAVCEENVVQQMELNNLGRVNEVYNRNIQDDDYV